MEKEIKIINKEQNIVRITSLDERWYSRPAQNKTTGLMEFEYLPSSTWIAGCWPKGIGYYKWLAQTGWDEAKAIMEEAGTHGSKVHQAVEFLEENNHLPIDMVFEGDPLTADDLDCILSFSGWWHQEHPQLLAKELTIFGSGYAGTLDRIYRIAGRIWIVDFKTSAYIWMSHRLQVSSYGHGEIDYKAMGITDEEWANRGLAILQLGYRLNKARYKFTEIDDEYENFKVALLLWAHENPDAKPKQKDYPLIITLKE